MRWYVHVYVVTYRAENGTYGTLGTVLYTEVKPFLGVALEATRFARFATCSAATAACPSRSRRRLTRSGGLSRRPCRAPPRPTPPTFSRPSWEGRSSSSSTRVLTTEVIVPTHLPPRGSVCAYAGRTQGRLRARSPPPHLRCPRLPRWVHEYRNGADRRVRQRSAQSEIRRRFHSRKQRCVRELGPEALPRPPVRKHLAAITCPTCVPLALTLTSLSLPCVVCTVLYISAQKRKS